MDMEKVQGQQGQVGEVASIQILGLNLTAKHKDKDLLGSLRPQRRDFSAGFLAKPWLANLGKEARPLSTVSGIGFGGPGFQRSGFR